MTITPNRLVAVLTPLVFAPPAGAVSVLIAEHTPGVDMDQGQLEAIFIAGATIAFGKAGLWLKGWQDYEKRLQIASDDVLHDVALEGSMPSASGGQADEPALDDDLDDDGLLAADVLDDDGDDDDLLSEPAGFALRER